MNTLKQKAGQILCLLFFVAIISGCVTDRRDARYSSSVVDYLYPSKTEQAADSPTINMREQLDRFKANIKDTSGEGIKVVHTPASICGTEQKQEPDRILSEVEPILKDGDIIFIRVSNFLYRRVAATSGSWESHVGILFRNQSGDWSVAESAFPFAKFSPLSKFIRRSENGRFLIRRYREGLTNDEKSSLRKSAEARIGRRYTLGFNYDSPGLYCSKFVHDVYSEAIGREVGRIQTFRELFSEKPDSPIGFWRIWFFGFIPWERRTVTTTSILRDERLVTIFDTKSPNHSSEPTAMAITLAAGSHSAGLSFCSLYRTHERPPV